MTQHTATARRRAVLKTAVGARHSLKIIDCDHCQRPLFREPQRCPGKPAYRPPVARITARGDTLCPGCEAKLYRTPIKRKWTKNPVVLSRVELLGRGI